MNRVRLLAKVVSITVAALATVILLLIGPIDRSPLAEKKEYTNTWQRLDRLQPEFVSEKSAVEVAWARVNITPDHPMPLAGYTLRKDFDSVHDSLFCRILAIRSASKTAYILSADLLLFPPAVRAQLENHLNQNPDRYLFFSATHTHNGVGGWDNSILGNMALGSFDEVWLNKTVEDITKAIERMEDRYLPSRISYFETEANDYAINRVDTSSPADRKLRGLKVIRGDSSTAVLTTFSAHATSISKKSRTLSGDYPAAVITQVEKQADFGIFLSGMVGSHRLNGIPEQEFDMVKKAGEVLSHKVLSAPLSASQDSLALVATNFPIDFAASQLRIAKDWKVRDWAFRLVLRPLEGSLSLLEIGNIMMIGTPCDFSGEISVEHKLDSLAALHQKHLIITSFNGNYDGYITADHHYEVSNKEEINTLNWVGPYHGAYFAEMIKKIIARQRN